MVNAFSYSILSGPLICLFNKTNIELCQNNERITFYPEYPNASWVPATPQENTTTGPLTSFNEGHPGLADSGFALYNSSLNPVIGDQASLISPVINTGGSSVCVSFAYYMRGK